VFAANVRGKNQQVLGFNFFKSLEREGHTVFVGEVVEAGGPNEDQAIIMRNHYGGWRFPRNGANM
jgi:hypothetical protein